MEPTALRDVHEDEMPGWCLPPLFYAQQLDAIEVRFVVTKPEIVVLSHHNPLVGYETPSCASTAMERH